MVNKLLPALLVLLSFAHAQDALDHHRRISTAASGAFDMSQEPRRFPFFLILEQETLRFPSFWTGEHHEGNLSFRPKTDMLTGELDLNAEGSFSVQVTRSPRKIGMEEELPGGPWMSELRERGFLIHFDAFRDAKPGDIRRGREGNVIEITAKADGRVEVDGKFAPMQAEVQLLFQERTPNFTLLAEFTFEGEPLGLTGDQAGPIQAKFSTLSPMGEVLPVEPDDPDDPFGDIGF